MDFKHQKLISCISGGGEVHVEAWVVQVSAESPHPGSQRAVFSLSSRGRRGEGGALWGPSYEGTNPIQGASPSWANHLPRAPPPNAITFIRTEHMNLGVHTYQSIAPGKK